MTKELWPPEERAAPGSRTEAGQREQPAPIPPPLEADTAEYIAQMAEELATLARNAQLGTIAYLLDMAQLEASGTSLRLRSE